jgi:hypothetical protein
MLLVSPAKLASNMYSPVLHGAEANQLQGITIMDYSRLREESLFQEASEVLGVGRLTTTFLCRCIEESTIARGDGRPGETGFVTEPEGAVLRLGTRSELPTFMPRM